MGGRNGFDQSWRKIDILQTLLIRTQGYHVKIFNEFGSSILEKLFVKKWFTFFRTPVIVEKKHCLAWIASLCCVASSTRPSGFHFSVSNQQASYSLAGP